MGTESSAASGPAAFSLVIERVFGAPRELVFKAWIDPKHLVQWLGPRGFRGTVIEMDARPGGAYRFHMRSGDGIEYWQQGVFREVREPDRFVRTCVWADADGNPTGSETLITVTFEEHRGKTRMRFEQVFDTAAACEAHRSGTTSALDRLGEYLSML